MSYALAEWRRELREGKRSRLTVDPLWRAACYDAVAADFRRLGLESAAVEMERESAAVFPREQPEGVDPWAEVAHVADKTRKGRSKENDPFATVFR